MAMRERCVAATRSVCRRRTGGAVEYGDRRLEAGFQCREVVAPFSDRNESTVTMPVGGIAQRLRQRRISRGRQAHSRKRVLFVRVEAGRNQQELRAELIDNWNDERLEDFGVIAICRAGLERNIQRKPRARAATDVLCRAGARVKRVLMRRDIQYARVFVENPLRAVAVMDVVVHDGDALHA